MKLYDYKQQEFRELIKEFEFSLSDKDPLKAKCIEILLLDVNGEMYEKLCKDMKPNLVQYLTSKEINVSNKLRSIVKLRDKIENLSDSSVDTLDNEAIHIELSSSVTIRILAINFIEFYRDGVLMRTVWSLKDDIAKAADEESTIDLMLEIYKLARKFCNIETYNLCTRKAMIGVCKEINLKTFDIFSACSKLDMLLVDNKIMQKERKSLKDIIKLK